MNDVKSATLFTYLLAIALLSIGCVGGGESHETPVAEAPTAPGEGLERLLAQAEEAQRSGRADEARDLLEKALMRARHSGDSRSEARALKGLGNLAMERWELERAREFHSESLRVARAIEDTDLEARALNNLGMVLQALGDVEASRRHLEDSLELSRRFGHSEVESRALVNLGSLLAQTGDSAVGIERLEEALELARRQGDAESEMLALFYLGVAHTQAGLSDLAIDWYQKALVAVRARSDTLREATVLNSLGFEYFNAGDSQQAVEVLQESLAVARDGGHDEQGKTALQILAVVYKAEGEPEKRLAVAQQLKAAAERTDDGERLRLAEDILREFGDESTDADWAAQVAYWKGQLEASTFEELDTELFGELADDPQFQQLNQTLRESDDRGLALRSLALLHEEREMWSEALEYGEELRQWYRERDEPTEMAGWSAHLGLAYLGAGEFLRAIDVCSEAFDTAPPVNKADDAESASFTPQARALACLAAAYAQMQDLEQSIAHLRRQIELEERLAKPHRRTHLNLGMMLALEPIPSEQLDPPPDAVDPSKEARRHLEAARETAQEVGDGETAATALSTLALMDYRQQRFRQAIQGWQQALREYRASEASRSWIMEESIALTRLQMASAYALEGEDDTALRLTQEAGEQLSRDSYGRVLTQHGLGYCHYLAERYSEASNALSAAAEGWEELQATVAGSELEQVAVLDGQLATFTLLQQALVGEGRPQEALVVAERARARALLNALVPGESRELRVEEIRDLAKSHAATLIIYSVLYDPQRAVLPAGLRGFQARLEDELLIWVVRADGEVDHQRVDLEGGKLERAVRGSHDVIDDWQSFIRGVGRMPEQELVDPLAELSERLSKYLTELYGLLIDPIRHWLPQAGDDESLVIIPHGRLFEVPFAALRDSDEGARYLVEDFDLWIAPSVAVLGALQRLSGGPTAGRRWAGDEVLVVGDPDLALELSAKPFELRPLPAARDEARAIADLLDTDALIGPHPTVAEIRRRLPSKRLLHFATHGILDYPAASGRLPGALVLAPATNHGGTGSRSPEGLGLLTALEIRKLALKADLAVLSACDTGRGRLSGDGVVGLARSFLAAGVPRLVVSLWQVPDEPTEKLMNRFYRQLEMQPNEARALRQAMRAAIREGSPPPAWAGFVVIGAPAS